MNDNRPWIEKYRPNKFEDIVLENSNKKLLNNIIKTNNFPNLLFYGPPGTGKTTTIINMINSYQIKHKQKKKGLMIHLNASDDRGIHIIRNQIINACPNAKEVSDREVAIISALKLLKDGDILLVAGKGHEEVQIVKNKLKYFSDKKVILEFLRKRL